MPPPPTLELVRRDDRPTSKPHARIKATAATLCAAKDIDRSPMTVLDPATVDITTVCAWCRRAAARRGLTIPHQGNTPPAAS